MISHYLLLSAAIFAIGAYGVLARRNLIVVLMSLELMLNGVNIALITFSLHLTAAVPGLGPHGHVFVLVVMAVAAAEVAVGLAIVISLFRTRQTIDTHELRMLNG
jgi:NADH-quinone oxidoreductase subunit K